MITAILTVDHPGDPVAILQQVRDLRLHDQLVVRLLTTGVGDHIEEVPLRYQSNVLMTARQPPQVGDAVGAGIELDTEFLDPARRESRELLSQPQLVQQGEGRGVHRVAAKVTEKVRMLFQDGRSYARPGHDEPEYQAGRTATDNTAACLYLGSRHMMNYQRRGSRPAQVAVRLRSPAASAWFPAAGPAHRRNTHRVHRWQPRDDRE